MARDIQTRVDKFLPRVDVENLDVTPRLQDGELMIRLDEVSLRFDGD